MGLTLYHFSWVNTSDIFAFPMPISIFHSFTHLFILPTEANYNVYPIDT